MNINSEYMSDFFKNSVLQEYCSSVKNLRTREQYVGYIRILCDKFVHKDFLEISHTDAERAINNMVEHVREGKLSRKTVCVRLSCYNSVSRYIEKAFPELEFENPFKGIERPTVEDKVSRYTIPSMEELDSILEMAKKTPMYHLIIAISTRTGMSATNILKIRKDTLFEENGMLGVYLEHQYNEMKNRVVIFPDDVANLFREYIKNEHIESKGDYVFYNQHKGPLTIKVLDYNIKKIVEQSGVEGNYTLKDMRSRAILDMVDNGATEKEITDYVGIGTIRIRQFKEASGIARSCPANLVNYRIINAG